MKQKKQLLETIEFHNDEEKLVLFKVEELETRLEMAASTGDGTTNGTCVPGVINDACW